MAHESDTRESYVNELRELIGGEKLSREEQQSSLQKLIASEKAAREKDVEEHAARHGQGLDALEEARKQQQASMEERIEQMLKDAAERDGAVKDHHATIGEELE